MFRCSNVQMFKCSNVQMSNIKCQISLRLNFGRSVPPEFLQSFLYDEEEYEDEKKLVNLIFSTNFRCSTLPNFQEKEFSIRTKPRPISSQFWERIQGVIIVLHVRGLSIYLHFAITVSIIINVLKDVFTKFININIINIVSLNILMINIRIINDEVINIKLINIEVVDVKIINIKMINIMQWY